MWFHFSVPLWAKTLSCLQMYKCVNYKTVLVPTVCNLYIKHFESYSALVLFHYRFPSVGRTIYKQNEKIILCISLSSALVPSSDERTVIAIVTNSYKRLIVTRWIFFSLRWFLKGVDIKWPVLIGCPDSWFRKLNITQATHSQQDLHTFWN